MARAERRTATRRKSRRPAGGRKGVKSSALSADNSRGTTLGGFEVAELQQLIDLVQRTGIGESEMSAGGRTVRISAQAGASPAMVVSAPVAGGAAATTPAAPGGAATGTEHLIPITSPMVGTFYRAPAPDADPYVEVGDLVEVGQTVCIIEAMKLMNEIESEAKGRVARILVDNTQPVEYGQKLFLIEPI